MPSAWDITQNRSNCCVRRNVCRKGRKKKDWLHPKAQPVPFVAYFFTAEASGLALAGAGVAGAGVAAAGVADAGVFSAAAAAGLAPGLDSPPLRRSFSARASASVMYWNICTLALNCSEVKT